MESRFTKFACVFRELRRHAEKSDAHALKTADSLQHHHFQLKWSTLAEATSGLVTSLVLHWLPAVDRDQRLKVSIPHRHPFATIKRVLSMLPCNINMPNPEGIVHGLLPSAARPWTRLQRVRASLLPLHATVSPKRCPCRSRRCQPTKQSCLGHRNIPVTSADNHDVRPRATLSLQSLPIQPAASRRTCIGVAAAAASILHARRNTIQAHVASGCNSSAGFFCALIVPRNQW